MHIHANRIFTISAVIKTITSLQAVIDDGQIFNVMVCQQSEYGVYCVDSVDECRNSRIIDAARVVIHEVIIAYKMYYVYKCVGKHRKDNFLLLFLLTTQNVKNKRKYCARQYSCSI